MVSLKHHILSCLAFLQDLLALLLLLVMSVRSASNVVMISPRFSPRSIVGFHMLILLNHILLDPTYTVCSSFWYRSLLLCENTKDVESVFRISSSENSERRSY